VTPRRKESAASHHAEPERQRYLAVVLRGESSAGIWSRGLYAILGSLTDRLETELTVGNPPVRAIGWSTCWFPATAAPQ